MKCDNCNKNESNHKLSRLDSNRKWITRNLCCYCYVMEGNAPASWHSECRAAYVEYLVNKYGRDPRVD